MEKLLASYLFQNRSCPLTGLGHLYITTAPAATDHANKKIEGTSAIIHFSTDEVNSEDLLTYVAHKTNSDNYEVTEAFDHFCDNLKEKLKTTSSADLKDIGSIYVDEAGIFTFKPFVLPAAYSPSVVAERVIHPEAEHNILVGDKETTNTLMTEYFKEEPVKKDRWWIWAIVLAAVAIGVIIIYCFDTAGSMLFGNAINY